MAIITISRGCQSRGREIAEEVARRLGYVCISRDILLDASEIFNASELKLEHAIHDAPSLLDRFTNGKERYVAYVKAALLRFLREDNVVYHGLAGHFFVRDIGHCLNVRILADMKERVAVEMEREKVSEKKARARIEQDDEERRKWGLWLYGIDTSDPSLYDLVLHLGRLGVQDAAEVICHTAGRPCFRSTPESRQELNDLALAARVHAALVENYPNIDVAGEGGKIRIHARSAVSANARTQERLSAEIATKAMEVPGVETAEVLLRPVVFLED